MDSRDIFERLNVVGDVRRQRLMTLISTCEEMLLLAGKGEWARVAQLESRRGQELKDYFSMPALQQNDAQKDGAIVKEVIAMLVTMNDQLVNIVTRARDQTGREVRAIERSKYAVRQYRSVQ
jgi:Flagellar protein FliT